MDMRKYSMMHINDELKQGGVSNLRYICDLADRIVRANQYCNDNGFIEAGNKFFRARNDYHEDEESSPGLVKINPLGLEEIGAPPDDKVKLGRFNRPGKSVLYLSSAPEVAIVECRANSSDKCTVGVFSTKKKLKLAYFMRHQSYPINVFFEENPIKEHLYLFLLSDVAEFASKKVNDINRDIHYRACNIIASAFMDSGFDGLIYRTSFWSPGWNKEQVAHYKKDGKEANIVLFDPTLAQSESCSVMSIDWLRPTATYQSNSIARRSE